MLFSFLSFAQFFFYFKQTRTKYWAETPEALAATKGVVGVFNRGKALLPLVPLNVASHGQIYRFDMIETLLEEELAEYRVNLASVFLKSIRSSVKSRRDGSFAYLVRFLNNLLQFTANLSSSNGKLHKLFFERVENYLQHHCSYLESTTSNKDEINKRANEFSTAFNSLEEADPGLPPTDMDKVVNFVDSNERKRGENKKSNRKRGRSPGIVIEDDADETPLPPRQPPIPTKRSRKADDDDDQASQSRSTPRQPIRRKRARKADDEDDETSHSSTTPRNPFEPECILEDDVEESVNTPKENLESGRPTTKTPERNRPKVAKRLESQLTREQTEQLSGSPRVIIPRITNKPTSIGGATKETGYPVTDPKTGKEYFVSLSVFIDCDKRDQRGIPYSFTELPTPTPENFDIDEILSAMDELWKYNIPKSSKKYNEAEENEDEFVRQESSEEPDVEEEDDEVWRIGYGNYYQHQSNVSIKAFLYDKTNEIAKQNTLMETLAQLINPKQFYQELFDKTVLISAPKLVLDAMKLSPDLWVGFNLIFSRNDGVNLTTDPVKAIDPYVSALCRAKGTNRVDCIVVILEETELFDSREINLKLGINSEDRKKGNPKNLASFLQFSLQRIAAKMKCPIFFAGYLDLKVPKDNQEAKVILKERERKSRYYLGKDEFLKYRQLAVGIQKELFDKRSIQTSCGSCNTTLFYDRDNVCSQCSPNARVCHVNATLMDLDFKFQSGKGKTAIPVEKLFTLQGRPSNVYLRHVFSNVKIFASAICLGLFRDNVTSNDKPKVPHPELLTGYKRLLDARDAKVKPKFEKFIWSFTRKLFNMNKSSKPPTEDSSSKEKEGNHLLYFIYNRFFIYGNLF
jgi:hypothetical protein